MEEIKRYEFKSSTVDDAVAAIREGLIQDAKTVEGILAAKAFGML